jgi:hypothetical protein
MEAAAQARSRCVGNRMRAYLYLSCLLVLNLPLAFAEWGSVYLSAVILLTYFTFRPRRLLHPNNMVFAFYGLYVVLSSTLNLVLELIDWEYVLPWGQQVFWNEISKYVLLQAEFTFLVLYFGFHFLCGKDSGQRALPPHATVPWGSLLLLYVLTMFLVLYFIEATAGLSAWIDDYSLTYLTKREGHGLLNVIQIVFGNIVVFLLGLRFFNGNDRLRVFLLAVLLIAALSFVTGVKSRLIFLLIMFLTPWFMTMQFRVKSFLLVTASFFVLLYLGTLVRTEGFYASAPFFLEMLIGYFNAFQLHDYIVNSRDPALLSTVFQVFVKPLQMLGLVGADVSYDISVMLTKEFFPQQWDDERATQQWPLDTELYLNYYGFYLSWPPLLAYAAFVSWLYRTAVLRARLFLLPIFIMEFQRIFSTLRGTLIPWDVFIYIGQYLIIYFVCRAVIERHPVRRAGAPHPRPAPA